MRCFIKKQEEEERGNDKGSQIQEGQHQGEDPMLQIQRIWTFHECF